MINEGTDIDSDGTCLLAGTVGTLHATRGLGNGFAFCIDAVVVVACPIVSQLFGWHPFEFDFVRFSVLFSCLCVNDLRFVEVWGCGENVLNYFFGVFGKGEPSDCGTNEPSEH